MSKEYWPTKIFVERAAAEDSLTKRVLSRLPNADIEYLDDARDPISELGVAGAAGDPVADFSRGKRWLMLQRHKGSWLKACPGTSEHVCCNLWVVNPGEGCPLDCTYCYLQTYLKRNPTLKLYSNLNDMTEEIKERVSKQPERLFRVGTGELIDSLVWDDLTESSKDLVPFFASLPNAMLELKTKTDNVDGLVELEREHCGKTVVAWSVNAKSITEKDEAFTASLPDRVAAAQRVVEAGYRVAFHFDPIVHFEGWEDEYRDTVEYIFSRISPDDVAWVSVSTLRYKPELQQVMLRRFPSSSLPYGEQFLAKDSKLRYVQPLRFRMLDFVWSQLKAVNAELPVYMCMESSAAWRKVSGGRPSFDSDLVEVFSRRGKLPIIGNERNVSGCGVQ